MTIKEIHDTILFIINKEQNGYITHAEIDQFLDRAQLVLFNQYHTNPKLPAQAQMSRYGENQRIDDALSAFKSSASFTTSSSGILTLASDYMHLLSLYVSVYDNDLLRNVVNPVQVLNEEELMNRLESQVIPVNTTNPVCIMSNSNTITLFPTQALTGKIYYFRRPVAPKFGYTQSGRTITYNPATYNSSTQPTGSIQMEWKDYDILNIISICLSYFGLNLSSGEIMQFAQLKTQEGQ